ncbi:NADH:flavin oxidoreductase/NADH oxidase [Arthrobacter sp. KNU40]|uniref:NADH:flavin oxidoreductase/NADH oxidase n=1 Tax=Arthrobacter sp. KNU40 TaxID=3447965 RepID=UPI003F5D9ED4
MSKLFEPMKIREVSIPNRIWMSPMCQYSAEPSGSDMGTANAWHNVHLGARASGGAGLIFTESTSVSPEGRITPWDLGLWNTRQRDSLAGITSFIIEQGSVPAIQIGHAGRKASTTRPWQGGRFMAGGGSTRTVAATDGGWQTVGPTDTAFGRLAAPEALSIEGIQGVVRDFASSAALAAEAGFKVLEVHGAHGYLLHEFMSAHSNTRDDEYGGSFENRIRLAVEVVDAVREVWPRNLPLFFRVSATDWLSENPEDDREGWTVDDTVMLAKVLVEHGVDLLDVSSGGIAPDAKIDIAPGYQVPFAAEIRRRSGIATGAVGKITEFDHANEIVADGQADAVLIGRELLRNPQWPLNAAAALDVEPQWPVQYGYAV